MFAIWDVSPTFANAKRHVTLAGFASRRATNQPFCGKSRRFHGTSQEAANVSSTAGQITLADLSYFCHRKRLTLRYFSDHRRFLNNSRNKETVNDRLLR